ncbi:hypothetical protein C8R43DRAFT_1132414 [Mycena crocata]|nr:hypothetical protein C8R43DRAFT_1132414 [Mycena crocata]
MSQYNSHQPAHAQRAHGAPPQADTLPLNRPPGLLPLLQQPQPNGMPPYTPNGPSQMFFTGIGPPYPFPFLPPQPQSDGVLPQFPPQFPPGIFPFRPNLPGLPQWPQTIVPLGPMTVFEEKVIVTALFDAGFRGVTPKVALDALHGTQGIPAHVWKDRYLDHKEGFDALVCSLRASANPGPTAVPNPPFPQGNTTAPAAATTKTPIYSRTEQAPESKGRPSVYPSRSTPPASVNVRTVKKPHYPRIKQSPPPLPESESESEGKSSSARPARSAAKLQSKALNQPSRGRTTMNSLTAHTAVYTKKLPPPSNQIRIPKTPSKEPTPPTGLTTQTSPTKFTDEEEDFFIGFILWSLQQDPVLLGAVSPCRTSAPPCNNLLNTLLHCGTRFADPGWYRAHDALLRMDPLARDDERGWGGSWLPAFDWRARAGRGFNSARARSSRFLTNLTTRAGWRAQVGFLLGAVSPCRNSAPPCNNLLNTLLHCGTRFADPGWYRAHDALLRMDPLARDDERGWGGSWLPAFDWRARAGRGFNSARARSSRFLTNLTTRAGWRARVGCTLDCRRSTGSCSAKDGSSRFHMNFTTRTGRRARVGVALDRLRSGIERRGHYHAHAQTRFGFFSGLASSMDSSRTVLSCTFCAGKLFIRSLPTDSNINDACIKASEIYDHT